MKPEIIERDVQVSLPNEQKAFSIESSPKAFQILSSNLYTDKPKAIIRELACNAYDAHVMVGKANEPFECMLPDSISPRLLIRDFGPGLSHTAVMSLYTTYFGSDKTHTNELIGGLGLGSKSPFSYTDAFTVVSRHNGRTYTYSAYLDSDHIPNITMLDNANSYGEPDGLEIMVPVNPADFRNFKEAASEVFKWFAVPPEHVTIGERTSIMKTDTCEVVSKSHYSSKNYVLMGNVCYAIPEGFIKTIASKEFMDKYRLVFYAKIGQLNIQPSRESLSMDKKTVRELEMLVNRARIEVEYEVNATIGTADTIIKAHLIAHEHGISKFMWRGKLHRTRSYFNCEHFRWNSWKKQMETKTSIYIDNIANDKKYMVMLSHRNRLRDIMTHNGEDISDWLFLKKPAEARDMCEAMDMPPIPTVSERFQIPKPERGSRLPREPVSLKINQYHYYAESWNSFKEIPQDIENTPDKPTCWVELDNNKPLHKHLVILARHFEIRVVGVPRSLKHVEKRMGCPHIKDKVQAHLNAFFADSYNYSAYKMWVADENVLSHAGIQKYENVSVRDLVDERPILKNFILLLDYFQRHNDLFRWIKVNAGNYNIKLPNRKPQDAIVIIRRFKKTYPTIWMHLQEDCREVIYLTRYKHYISLLERKRK